MLIGHAPLRAAGAPEIRRPVLFGAGNGGMGLLTSGPVFLFLDFDGTLVELAPRPEDTHLSPERRRCLHQLTRAAGVYVAIVSGRSVEDLQSRIAVPELIYVGNHGLEWTAPGETVHHYPISERTRDALQFLRDQFGGNVKKLKGVLLEDKKYAIALHYRMANQATALNVRNEFFRAVKQQQHCGAALEILAGKKVIEAKPVSRNKSDAVSHLLKRYAPEAFPIYFGDDKTDETAFRYLETQGITVLIAETPRPTAASFYLSNPNEVYAFLRYLMRMKKGPR
jgi:trehalose 6-phosphate phosphatase